MEVNPSNMTCSLKISRNFDLIDDLKSRNIPYDFIPPYPPGQIAQSVEQRTENPCVGGSIPPLATIIYSIKSDIKLG